MDSGYKDILSKFDSDGSEVNSEDGEGGEGDKDANAEAAPAEPVVEEPPMSEELIEIMEYIQQIVIRPPNVYPPPSDGFDPAQFPLSYRENTQKERLVLAHVDNFRKQYVHLYKDRRPLLLSPVNECGTEKFICTILRPTLLPFEELFHWKGASEFVADYLDFVKLKPVTELPQRILSPTTVLKRQAGNSFEYSIILCSLLLGAGYDAYVVSGYATRELCNMDLSRTVCPLLIVDKDKAEEMKAKPQKKYTVKPCKDLQSKFEQKMEQRKIETEKLSLAKKAKEEEERIKELEKPEADALYGQRVHSWVLIRGGKREVPEDFFIDPYSAVAYPTGSDQFLGVESVWNHANYWVNMQDCRFGLKHISFDLDDSALWEYIFPHPNRPLLKLPLGKQDEVEEDDEDEEEIEKYLDMPASWTDQISITLQDFERRCPHGKKTLLFKKAKLDKFAPYLNADGLISRLYVYDDYEMTDQVEMKDVFFQRKDRLISRMHNYRTGWTTEYFARGRPKSIKEHRYRPSNPGAENERTMLFYHEARFDGLEKRDETPTSMTEYFQNRADQLHYRHVEFGKRPKVFGPASDAGITQPRQIMKMIERYHKHPDKPPDEDVQELRFLCSDDKILITYHTRDGFISSSRREFTKPVNQEEKGILPTYSPEMHTEFQVDWTAKAKKNVYLWQLLLDLIAYEERLKGHVHESEHEVREILQERTQEDMKSELVVSVYDVERNEKAKKQRKWLEQLQNEERLREHEREMDYLAPFLAQLDDPTKITRTVAVQLKERCLKDEKERLINQANQIQMRFEEITKALQEKQKWYQQNQISLTKEDEEEYYVFCRDATFRIQILEQRLNRHFELAPKKYTALEEKLQNDPRLAILR